MSQTPLADRLRPNKLADFVGQTHLVGENGILRKLMEADNLVSMIFWGPPGVGKTTLARLIALSTKSEFIAFSAVSTTIVDLRKVLKQAKETKLAYGKKTILFMDEIHRFNKLQQDAFLPEVENGSITLIGATTENPSFEVIGPLLSRCRVFVLKPLTEEELMTIAKKATSVLKIKAGVKALKTVICLANGDARSLINIIEIINNTGVMKIDEGTIRSAVQNKLLLYDQSGEEHYNTISAFIKSMRASNVDASLYYLARMVESGEDPLFIARRMVVFASEDVASPTALVVANAVFQACQFVGYPECQENLAAGTVYLAKAPKERLAYDGYMEALSDVRKLGNLPIPMNLRNAPTKLMKELGYGRDYKAYTNESLLPENIKGKKYYKT